MSRDHWEKEASNWAAWARTPDFDAYWKYSPHFFDLLPSPGVRTLEVGCGEGRVSRDLVKRGHRVVAIDSSPTLLRLAYDADSRGAYLLSDAAGLPFVDGSFDLAVFYNSLMDIDDMEGAVREAARVLRPGGALCACVTHPTADAGRFESRETNAPFTIRDTYLGDRRWFAMKTKRNGLRMHFAGWAYTLEGYFSPLERAGFVIQAVREPRVDGGGRWRRIPNFLMWRAVKTA